MPITLETVSLQYKSLPITLHEDGSCTVSLRKGYFDEFNNFVIVGIENYHATSAETSTILDVEGLHGLTRRDDLSLAIYQFCISKGAQVGVIT